MDIGKLVWANGRLACRHDTLGGRAVVRLLNDGRDITVDPRDIVPVPEELAGRIDPERLELLQESRTRRPVSPGAERWLGIPVKVLDHGFVVLVDYMGTDESIVRAARVSTGSRSKGREDDRRLIRYLRRNQHTSPFEHVEVSFHVRLPIFVARQWVRHRTAHLNEYSARYSVLADEFYLPGLDDICMQDTSNRQGRGEALRPSEARMVQGHMLRLQRVAYRVYEKLLQMGVARELARIILPVSIYTEWYWKIDFHNLLHFLKLRLDPHAQAEIREYAKVIATIVRDGWPLAWEAFEDYTLHTISLSRSEQEVIRLLGITIDPQALERACQRTGISGSEKQELIRKLQCLEVYHAGTDA